MSFTYNETRIAFINSHLAAHLSKWEYRNQDYCQIVTNLTLQPPNKFAPSSFLPSLFLLIYSCFPCYFTFSFSFPPYLHVPLPFLPFLLSFSLFISASLATLPFPSPFLHICMSLSSFFSLFLLIYFYFPCCFTSSFICLSLFFPPSRCLFAPLSSLSFYFRPPDFFTFSFSVPPYLFLLDLFTFSFSLPVPACPSSLFPSGFPCALPPPSTSFPFPSVFPVYYLS